MSPSLKSPSELHAFIRYSISRLNNTKERLIRWAIIIQILLNQADLQATARNPKEHLATNECNCMAIKGLSQFCFSLPRPRCVIFYPGPASYLKCALSRVYLASLTPALAPNRSLIKLAFCSFCSELPAFFLYFKREVGREQDTVMF